MFPRSARPARPIVERPAQVTNRSALEWVIHQYQLSEDPRSGIKSDPNRADDAE